MRKEARQRHSRTPARCKSCRILYGAHYPKTVRACQPHCPGCQRVGRRGRNRLIHRFRRVQHGIGELSRPHIMPASGRRSTQTPTRNVTPADTVGCKYPDEMHCTQGSSNPSPSLSDTLIPPGLQGDTNSQSGLQTHTPKQSLPSLLLAPIGPPSHCVRKPRKSSEGFAPGVQKWVQRSQCPVLVRPLV